MPFPDELPVPGVIAYRAEWPAEFERFRARLASALGGLAVGIDHVGSTAVPGLAAKDCIDLQVRVQSADVFDEVEHVFEQLGFRLRSEAWNRSEVASGQAYPKLVFAPPIGARRCNVHVRVDRQEPARRNLLFRDYLAANPEVRDAWADFKTRLSRQLPDLAAYGQVKAPAWEALMNGAERWRIATAPASAAAAKHPMIHLIHGYLCAGKTRFAKQLEAETGAVRLTMDDWMIAASGDRQHLDPVLYERVRSLLDDHWMAMARRGIELILDFGFWSRAERDAARQAAAGIGAASRLYWVTCPEEVTRQRCRRRNVTRHRDYYFDEGAFDALIAKFEPLDRTRSGR